MPDSQKLGPALAKLIDTDVALKETDHNKWSRDNGVSASTILHWSRGQVPSVELLSKMAVALDMTRFELLVRIGYITAEEAGAKVVREPEPDVIRAIKSSDAPNDLKKALSGMARDHAIALSKENGEGRAR